MRSVASGGKFYQLPPDKEITASSVFEVGINTAESSRMTPKGNIQTDVTAWKGDCMLRTDLVINKIAID